MCRLFRLVLKGVEGTRENSQSVVNTRMLTSQNCPIRFLVGEYMVELCASGGTGGRSSSDWADIPYSICMFPGVFCFLDGVVSFVSLARETYDGPFACCPISEVTVRYLLRINRWGFTSCKRFQAHVHGIQHRQHKRASQFCHERWAVNCCEEHGDVQSHEPHQMGCPPQTHCQEYLLLE